MICFMLVGPEDYLEVFISYGNSFLLTAVVSVALWIAVRYMQRGSNRSRFWTDFGICVVAIPAVCWIMYFTITIPFNSTLIFLDSESSNLAEYVYENNFKKEVSTLDAAVRLAVDYRQFPSVRFYASCLIAEMLTTNNEQVLTKVLKEVEGAPLIETQFIGGNRLTTDFYIPGHDQVHIYPGDVIQRRLRSLRQRKQ
jgi:hypothetical protein